MSLPKELLDILVCPKSKAPLEHHEGPPEVLVCRDVEAGLSRRGWHSHHAHRGSHAARRVAVPVAHPVIPDEIAVRATGFLISPSHA